MSLGSKIEGHDLKLLCSSTLTVFAVKRRKRSSSSSCEASTCIGAGRARFDELRMNRRTWYLVTQVNCVANHTLA
jgi:hypothetical protein